MFISVFLWLLILAVALVARLVGLRYGLPAVYNPDEVAIMSRTLAFAKGDLNPHNFLYPTFYFYALFAWEGLTAALAVAVRAVDSFGAFQREFFMDPTRVFVAGRLLTALLGTSNRGRDRPSRVAAVRRARGADGRPPAGGGAAARAQLALREARRAGDAADRARIPGVLPALGASA